MDLVNKARALAIKAHTGQTRKNSGLPYIVHPEAVLKKFDELIVPSLVCSLYSGVEIEEARAACLLHDVIEDTNCKTLGDFIIGFKDASLEVESIYYLVRELTDTSKEQFPFASRMERKAIDGARMYNCSRLAQMIKVCDIMCNVSDYTLEDPAYAIQYIKEKQKYSRFLINLPVHIKAALKEFLEQKMKEAQDATKPIA